MSAEKRRATRVADSDDGQTNNDVVCGIFGLHPDWLQQFATPKVFLVNFSIVAIAQSAYFTYLVGSMSTLEKRYAFESKISGFILIADNISQILINPIIGYLGAHCNRPRLIAFGEILVALSCFLTALPYFIYGPGLHLLSDEHLAITAYSNITNYEICDGADKETGCAQGSHATVVPAVVILWIASFINGLGYTAFYTIGLPYLDDNVKKKNSPMYLSSVSTIRLLGPSLGFLISSVCLRMFEDPFYDPGVTRSDPRFVGAWWVGFVILGLLITITTLPLFLFPASLPTVSGKKPGPEPKQSFKEAKESFFRLAKNPVLCFQLVGGILRVLGMLGYYIFQPKYMEANFRKTASEASFYAGTASVAMMAIGIMAGGFYVSKARPGPRTLASLMFVVELFANFSLFIAMFLGCQPPSFGHGTIPGTETLTLHDTCNEGCGCTQRVYQPSCANGMTTYFSPCYAGCSNIASTGSNQYSFTNCDCLGGDKVLEKGYCPQDTNCSQFITYIVVLSIGNFIASMARTGNYLITFRCVEQRDKSFAMGIIGTLMALFAFIPYPIIFGYITDSSCLIWEEACGKTGNCWVYDLEKFRYYLHSAAFGLMMVGSLVDIGVIAYAHRIKNIYDDDDEPPEEPEQVAEKIKLRAVRSKDEAEDEDIMFDSRLSSVN